VTRLADLQRHMSGMRELGEIVGAMRSLAGMRLQETQRALPYTRRYGESLAAAIGAAVQLMPEPAAVPAVTPGRRRLLILCAAEHGFVGGFNERLVTSGLDDLGRDDDLLVLGSRGAALLAERGVPVAWAQPMPTRVAGVPDPVDALTGELYRRIANGDVARVEVRYGRYRQGTESTIERRLLLPLDTVALARVSPRQPPLHNLRSEPLFERLVEEYVYARLAEAAVESIASENAARFAAMESAHDSVARRLSALAQEARAARQEEITAELLDLIVGAEAQRPTHPQAGSAV